MLLEIHAVIEEIRNPGRQGTGLLGMYKKTKGRENDENEDHGAVGN
jgi:hypothetical protein